ncbi:MAG: hypothetical protein Q8O55_06945 [Dehalococcoidales bacterium]|nr:hypothetical protein [Dehalococcoidales bacterium]
MRTPGNIYIDQPSFAIIQALISYWGVTSSAGNAFGTSLIDVMCGTTGQQPNYEGLPCKINSGGAAGQVQTVWAHNLATGELTFANPWTDYNGAVQVIAANTRFLIGSFPGGGGGPGPAPGGNYGPTVFLAETWQDELGIDFTRWTTTNPATGTAWARGAIGDLLMAYAAPAANENARLRSNQRWIILPTLTGPSRIVRKTYLEFEFHVVNLANLDNVNFFMGFTQGIADVRTTNNIVGVALIGAGNALQTVTDAGGAETVNTGFGENLLLTNKVKVEISLNSCEFSLNEVTIANHVANIPDLPMYINFYGPTNGLGAANFRIGGVRAWHEDVT